MILSNCLRLLRHRALNVGLEWLLGFGLESVPESFKIGPKRPLGGLFGGLSGPKIGPKRPLGGLLGGSWGHLGSRTVSRAKKVPKREDSDPLRAPLLGAKIAQNSPLKPFKI